jgi:hypothetical protein
VSQALGCSINKVSERESEYRNRVINPGTQYQQALRTNTRTSSLIRNSINKRHERESHMMNSINKVPERIHFPDAVSTKSLNESI